MTLLQCQQLTVRIADKTVCQQLEWHINPGQFWVVLGQNGVGKTSLLHCLAGLQPVTTGSIFLHGRALGSYSTRQRAQLLALLLQQQTSTFPSSVEDAVMAGRHPHIPYWHWPQQHDKKLVTQALQIMQLQGLEQRCISTLSGGELQRVQLATVLCQTPSLYLLDEPLTHLDIKHQLAVMQHFQQLCQQHNVAVVMVLHDLFLARQFASHALALYGNGQYLLGEQQTILNKRQLATLYQCEHIEWLYPA